MDLSIGAEQLLTQLASFTLVTDNFCCLAVLFIDAKLLLSRSSDSMAKLAGATPWDYTVTRDSLIAVLVVRTLF
jgi:hypothetical protein